MLEHFEYVIAPIDSNTTRLELTGEAVLENEDYVVVKARYNHPFISPAYTSILIDKPTIIKRYLIAEK